MDYGALIGDAWRTTWRNRYLWVLGLFAGGAAGIGSSGGRAPSGVNWRVGQGDLANMPPEAAARVNEVATGTTAWVTGHVGLLVAAGVVALLLGLVVLALSLIAQGGMAEATVDLAQGRGSSLGQAWRAGLRLVWRYAGLWLALICLGIAVAAVVGALAAATIAGGVLLHASTPVIVLLSLAGIALVLAGIVVAVGVSVMVAYAQRAIYVDDVGPIEALQHGWQLLRAHPGVSVLVWLVNVAVSVGAGIVAAIILTVVVAVLAAIAVAFWYAAGWSAALIAYAAVAVLALIAIGLTVGAVVNTFYWNYWTLAYLRLREA